MRRVRMNVLWEIFAGKNVTLFFVSSVLEQKVFSVVLKLHSTCSEEKFNFLFSEFSQTLPGFWATVFEKGCQNRISCYQWYLLQEKTKNFNFKTSHWVSRTTFRKSWQNHFPFVQGHFFETKCFLQKTFTMKFLNFSSTKLPSLRKKSHSVDEIAFDEHGETMWKKK